MTRFWLAATLLFAATIGAQEVDFDFMRDRASRITFVDDEIKDLQRERACLVRAKNRAQMRLCNR